MAEYTAAARARRAAEREERDRPIEIHASRLKHGVLAAAPFFVASLAIGELVGVIPGEHGTGVTIAAAAIGLLAAAVLLSMGFDRRPVLVIDHDGITCRRPAVGLIPWRTIAGMGMARAALVRRVLLVALDLDDERDEALRRQLERNTSSSMGFFSSQVAHFKGQVNNRPTIQVPISFLSVSPADLQRLIEERVHYRGD